MSTTSPVVGSVVSGWIACGFDGVTLLIPIEDAGARVDIDELEPATGGDLSPGAIRWQDCVQAWAQRGALIAAVRKVVE